METQLTDEQRIDRVEHLVNEIIVADDEVERVFRQHETELRALLLEISETPRHDFMDELREGRKVHPEGPQVNPLPEVIDRLFHDFSGDSILRDELEQFDEELRDSDRDPTNN